MTTQTPTPTASTTPQLKDISLLVPGEVMQNVLNYLATKPFNEVAGLVEQIRSKAKQVKMNDDDKAPTEAPAKLKRAKPETKV